MNAHYLPRVVDAELDALLAGLPAVAIEGPRSVGKTVTAARRAKTIFALDDQGMRELMAADPSRIDRATPPVLVDEWQRHPPVWDAIRRSVDRDRTAGRIVLTGSATPTEAPTHSGAGRIVRVRMRPMSLFERALETATVSLEQLLSGSKPPIDGKTSVTLPTYTEEIVASGFPAIRTLPARPRRAQLDGYLAGIAEHDFPEQGHLVRRPGTLRAWLTAYAAATSTNATYTTILNAATAGEADKPSKTTTMGYRDVLAQIWMVEPVPGWLPVANYLGRLTQAPKHHLADPALAARLLGLSSDGLLAGQGVGPAIPKQHHSLLGALFESLVALDLRVYAQHAEARVSHLRTADARHEVDFIVERDDHRVVAVEVKLSGTVTDDDVTHLHWLRDHMGDDLLDAAVIYTGAHAYRRRDGIAVIPAALLGP